MKAKIEFNGQSVEQIHAARDGQRFSYAMENGKYQLLPVSGRVALCSVHHGSINAGQATHTVVKDFKGKVIYSGVRDND